MPDVFAEDKHFGFLQIELKESGAAVFQNFATGATDTNIAFPLGQPIDISF
jgi:hypothetical protein